MNWTWLDKWISDAPMLAVGASIFVLMTICAVIGTEFGRRSRAAKARRSVEDDGKDDGGQEGYVVSAVLGLLALLLGFTFSLAVDRFDARRLLVLQEANAIGTTYLRAQLLPEPHRARVSDLLVRYTDNRIVLAKTSRLTRAHPLLVRNDALIIDLWTATVAAFPSIKGLDFSSAFIESMNNLVDLDASRKAARRARVPTEVFAVLAIYLFVTAGVLGYVMKDTKGRVTAGILLPLLTLSLLLIIDIDRPLGGGVVEGQGPMETLRRTLESQTPAIFDRWSAPVAAAPVR